MKRVFADTYYFLAIFNRKDRHHARTVEVLRRGGTRPMVTTQWVLVEFADAMSGSSHRSEVLPFLEQLESDPDVEIVPSTPDHLKDGLRLYHARPDKSWSLTDCISFVVMREEDLLEALTGDHHFEQAGFVALLA